MPRRGENIYKRKDGRWEGRYIKEKKDGKIRYGYVYAKTYKCVKEKLQAQQSAHISQIESQNIVLDNQQNPESFEIIANEWLMSIKPQIKQSSYVKYFNILNKHLLPKYKTKQVNEISKDDVMSYIASLLTDSNQAGKGLSSKTVTSILSVLKNIFVYSIDRGFNVADISKISVKQSQNKLRVFSFTEQQKLNKYLYSNISHSNLGIMVCLYTGLRVGEICALKWADIIWDEQCIKVSKTMQRLQNVEEKDTKTHISITTPKSECSIRRIPIPDEIFKLLQDNKEPANTYFLTGETDVFIEPRTMQNHFKVVLTKCDIRDANFHTLRHTFATRCVELGFDIKSLSEILGHASVNITMNRYVHPSMDLKKQNMNKLSALLTVS